MTNTNNLKLIENKKPVEIVHELKDEYKIPSFEEFMKDYQADEGLNYDDLKGEVKGYGPCLSEHCDCSKTQLRMQLHQKQKDLEEFWQKYLEYDERWEEYRVAVVQHCFEKKEDDDIFKKVIEHPATSLLPIPAPISFRFGMYSRLRDNADKLTFKETLKQCYSRIAATHNEIMDWYREVYTRYNPNYWKLF